MYCSDTDYPEEWARWQTWKINLKCEKEQATAKGLFPLSLEVEDKLEPPFQWERRWTAFWHVSALVYNNSFCRIPLKILELPLHSEIFHPANKQHTCDFSQIKIVSREGSVIQKTGSSAGSNCLAVLLQGKQHLFSTLSATPVYKQKNKIRYSLSNPMQRSIQLLSLQ